MKRKIISLIGIFLLSISMATAVDPPFIDVAKRDNDHRKNPGGSAPIQDATSILLLFAGVYGGVKIYQSKLKNKI